MAQWNDYNDADQQMGFDLIPKGTVCPVVMRIRAGGHNNLNRGWDGGYAKENAKTGAVYLDCEFTIMAGEYSKRKIFSLIGLHSPKGPDWSNQGRAFIRGILNSSRGLSDKDTSPNAMEARRIRGFGDLDGIEFLARIDVGKDSNGDQKNEIKYAVTPDDAEYAGYQPKPFVATPAYQPPQAQQTYRPPQQTYQQPQQQQPSYQQSVAAGPIVRPSWAG